MTRPENVAPGHTFPINEVFRSIQGEGHWQGTPSLFIRFHGCPVGCPWCDTKYTWVTKPDKEVSVDQMLAKQKDAITYARLDIQQFRQLAGRNRIKHIVLTGGEPCMFDLTELTDRLEMDGFSTQIETSGTHVIRCSFMTWVTVSPKLGMPGKFPVLPTALAAAKEIKIPVASPRDLDLGWLPDQARQRVWLQPVSQDEEMTELCVKACIANGYRLSVQMHKYLGVR